MSKPFSHENVWSLRGRGPQEVLYCGQMIDIPLVTSLRQKERWGKRRQQSIQTLQRGAQKRGDALSNSQQQGPKERHLKVRLSCFSLSLSLSQKSSVLAEGSCSLVKMFREASLYLDRLCLREAVSS